MQLIYIHIYFIESLECIVRFNNDHISGPNIRWRSFEFRFTNVRAQMKFFDLYSTCINHFFLCLLFRFYSLLLSLSLSRIELKCIFSWHQFYAIQFKALTANRFWWWHTFVFFFLSFYFSSSILIWNWKKKLLYKLNVKYICALFIDFQVDEILGKSLNCSREYKIQWENRSKFHSVSFFFAAAAAASTRLLLLRNNHWDCNHISNDSIYLLYTLLLLFTVWLFNISHKWKVKLNISFWICWM